jgi:hypothetical protein
MQPRKLSKTEQSIVKGDVAGSQEASLREEALARERDLKFKKWLQNKAIKEKAFEVRRR